MVVESEVAVELGDDARSIVALLPALEVADPPDLDQDVETILAGNIFHRAVAFGPRVETAAPGGARILVNDEIEHEVGPAETAAHLEAMVDAVARRLPTPTRTCRRATASSPAYSPRRTPPTRATACGSSWTRWAASSFSSPA